MYGIGEYFRSGCHITILGVVYWNIPQSQAGSSLGIQIHQDTIKDWTPGHSHMSKSRTRLSKLEELQDRRRHILFICIIVVSTHANIG